MSIEKMSIETTKGTSNIQEYFAGKNIFLTGATGFMGKCFVDKVLRDIPDLKNLYVLVRETKGLSPKEKIKKYFQDIVFNRLKEVQPNFEEKIVTISGDLQEDRLGLSAEDRQKILDEVDIFIHSGAVTKFNERVNVSLKINVLGTKAMLDLAMESKRIESFTYVSTAYSHCYNKNIEERFYDPPGDLKIVYDMIDADINSKNGLTEDAIEMLCGKWPNIYCFSKSMAEELVRQYGEKNHFACGVNRPSVVTAAIKEPMEGWHVKNSGPALMFMGASIGALHCTYNLSYPLDLIPVDYSINALIAAVYDLPKRYKKERRPVVYNFGSSVENPVTIVQMFDYTFHHLEKLGLERPLWYPFVYFTDRKWLFNVLHIFLHFIPALFADVALLCMRRKPMALAIFWFATKHMSKVDYFSNGNWRIHVKETLKVYGELSAKDKEIFDFNIRSVDWLKLIKKYVTYGKAYVLKESSDDNVKAIRNFKRMRLLHYVTVMILFLIFLYCMLRLVRII